MHNTRLNWSNSRWGADNADAATRLWTPPTYRPYASRQRSHKAPSIHRKARHLDRPMTSAWRRCDRRQELTTTGCRWIRRYFDVGTTSCVYWDSPIFTKFSACYLWRWPGPSLTAMRYVMYFRLRGWSGVPTAKKKLGTLCPTRPEPCLEISFYSQ